MMPGGRDRSDTRADSSGSSGAGAQSFPHTLQPGSQFGRYQLQQELGRGAMGIVWRARQVDLDRDVAIKMLLQGPVAGDRVRSRFLAEARSVARLVHPNIVAIHDVGERDGIHFFTMDFVDGPPLSTYIKSNTVSLERALEIAQDVAEALDYAHQQGIVHRDLKPANILLNNQGTARITDFGIAKDTTVESHTQAGEMLGTPAYMSPEQASGRSDTVDGRADVYSLGAIMYRILTGKAPFEGKTPYDVIRKVAVEKPVSPRKLNGQVPRDVDAIILRCLAKERDDRYANAGELAKALGDVRRGLRQKRRPRGGSSNLPLMALHVALVLIGVGGVGAAVWWRFSGAGGAVSTTDETPAGATSSEQEAAVAKARAAVEALRAGGSVDQALVDAEAALQIAPDRAEVLTALGEVLLHGDDAAAALERIEAGLALDASYLPGRVARGRCLMVLERPAAEIRDEALRLEDLGIEGKIAAAELLADHALSLSSYSVAIEHLREAVNLAPKDADRHLRLATVYLRAGRHTQAEEEASESLDLDGSSAAALLVRAKARVELGKKEAAREDAQAAFDLDDTLTEAEELVAKLRKPVRPQVTPRPTRPRQPDRPPQQPAGGQEAHQRTHGMIDQGTQALRGGDQQGANRFLEQAHRDPSFGCQDGLLARAQLALGLGRGDRALQDLQRLHQAHGATMQTTTMLAQALAISGRPADALKLIERALQQAPNQPQLLSTRATVLESLGKFPEAAQAWLEFGKATPRKSQGPHQAAHAFEKANRHEEAVEAFQVAVKREPGDGHLHTALGKALDVLGRGDEALAAFKAALAAPNITPEDRQFAQQRVASEDGQ
jgi:tetratricopeptide (TPR) repeat protein/predicted Ser/Thr protein kinase